MSRWSRDPWQEAMDKQRNARILAARETWPKCSLKSDEPVAKPASPAPDLKEALGEVSCAFADVAHGDADDVCDIELGVLVPIARGEDGPEGPVLAHVAELDRAVQSEIARAFGEMVKRLLIASQSAHLASFSPPKQEWTRKQLAQKARDHQRLAVTRFAAILHTAMGGRIPDEVP